MIELPFTHHPAWLPDDVATRLQAHTKAEVPFEVERAQIGGKLVRCPRMSRWYAPDGCDYTYSGVVHRASPVPPWLAWLMARASRAAQQDFNSVLVNKYATGHDACGAHSDDEPPFRAADVIASVSVGAARNFVMLHKATNVYPRTHRYKLGHGDLFIMWSGCQARFKHALPPDPCVMQERINFTFRTYKKV